jgi:hypothetical protein
MKTKLILAAILGIIFSSCHKENLNSNYSKSIVGEWNWISSTGGISGIKYTPETEGEKRIISFDSDSVFRLYANDTLKIESKYHLIILPSTDGLDSTRLVKYDFTSVGQYFEIQPNGILILRDDCMDCFLDQYKRIK